MRRVAVWLSCLFVCASFGGARQAPLPNDRHCQNLTCAATSRNLPSDRFDQFLEEFGGKRGPSRDAVAAPVTASDRRGDVHEVISPRMRYSTTTKEASLTVLGRRLAVQESFDGRWRRLNDSSGGWRRELWSESGQILVVEDEHGSVLKVERDESGNRKRILLGQGGFKIVYENADDGAWQNKWVEGPELSGALGAVLTLDRVEAMTAEIGHVLAQPRPMFELKFRAKDGRLRSMVELRAVPRMVRSKNGSRGLSGERDADRAIEEAIVFHLIFTDDYETGDLSKWEVTR